MPKNLYADAVPAGQSEPAAPEEEETSDSSTAVIPKALLSGKEWKPGDQITLEIVQMNEDGAVVKYASESGSEEESEAPEPEAAPPAQEAGGMSSMME